jgi:hypothetical protein
MRSCDVSLPASQPAATVPAVATAALSPETLERVIIDGDLSGLSASQKIEWYRARCDAAGLDPRSQPFQYLRLNNRLVLYATKSATDNLTGVHKLSVEITDRSLDRESGIYTVQCRVRFPDGRNVEDCGVVPIMGLKGDALANAVMKGVTKAKRRTVLSACGLGMLDETEVETIADARSVPIEAAHEDSAVQAREPGQDDVPCGYVDQTANGNGNGHANGNGNGVQSGNRNIWNGPPRDAGGLYRWAKLMGEQWRSCRTMVAWLEAWGHNEGLGRSFKAWPPNAVERAYHDACTEYEIGDN